MACILPGIKARSATPSASPVASPPRGSEAAASGLFGEKCFAPEDKCFVPGLPRVSASSRATGNPSISPADQPTVCGDSSGSFTRSSALGGSSALEPKGAPQLPAAIAGDRSTDRFCDLYALGGILGQGSFGIVYACHRRDGDGIAEEQLAVKMVDKVETPEDEIRREAELQLRLDHPNIVKVHQVFHERCFVCILMDVCRGGDLISAMEAQWDQAGGVWCGEVAHLCRQMSTAVDFLHSQGIAHRDVKGDNFLLDRPSLSDPDCCVALGDFGTAVEVREGARLRSRVGTRNHWAPEVFRADYGPKVDVWALGVVIYALIEGKFPFADEPQIFSLAPEFSEELPDPCADFLCGLLCKSESERPSAAEAAGHSWLRERQRTLSGCLAAREAHRAGLRERGPDCAVGERRQELVRRMTTAASARSLRRTTTARQFDEGAQSPHFWASSFETIDRRTGARRLMEWWPVDRAREHGAALDELPPELSALVDPSGDVPSGDRTTNRAVSHILNHHGVNTSLFGCGVARTVEDLAGEIRSGASRLMLDATAHKKLVRVVDLVLLRVTLGAGSGSEVVLLECGKEFVDGREVWGLDRLPAAKREPHESAKQVVERTLNNILGPHKSTARYSLKDTEVFETEEDSASYPGVRTVYRKELVKVHLVASPGYSLSFVDEQGTRRFLSWWSTSECADRGIQLNAPDEPEGFSSLVPAPVGMDEDELRLFLRSGGVDLSDVGRPLEDLSAELVRGECALRRRPDGGVLRVVDVIMLKLERVDTGEILIQTGEVSTCGQEGPARNLLPSGKRRPDENQFDAAKRILTSSLKIDEKLHQLRSEQGHRCRGGGGLALLPWLTHAVPQAYHLSRGPGPDAGGLLPKPAALQGSGGTGPDTGVWLQLQFVSVKQWHSVQGGLTI